MPKHIHFILPEDKKPSDLDEKVTSCLNKYKPIKVKTYDQGEFKCALYEIPNQGAIEFDYFIEGNKMTTFEHEEDGVPKEPTKQLWAGCLMIVGFDENSDYFSKLMEDLGTNLKEYIDFS